MALWGCTHVKLLVSRELNEICCCTTCVGGNAYLHQRLSRFFEAEGDKEKQLQHREHVVTAINVALTQLPSRPRRGEGIDFYIGSAGKEAAVLLCIIILCTSVP